MKSVSLPVQSSTVSHKQCHDRIKAKNEIIAVLENRIMEADERIQLLELDTMHTLQDGKTFNTRIREASYYMQNLGLSEAKVSKALPLIVRAICDKELVGPLPSYRSQNRFGDELIALSKQQIKDVLVSENNTTLMFDGTTKSGHHLTEVEIGTKNSGAYLLGIREQSGGRATEYIDTINKSVGDIESQKSLSDQGLSVSTTKCNEYNE